MGSTGGLAMPGDAAAGDGERTWEAEKDFFKDGDREWFEWYIWESFPGGGQRIASGLYDFQKDRILADHRRAALVAPLVEALRKQMQKSCNPDKAGQCGAHQMRYAWCVEVRALIDAASKE